MGKKHKHKKGKLGNTEFLFTGKLEPQKKKVKVGEAEFVKNQHEKGVVKKLKGATSTSLFYVHGKE